MKTVKMKADQNSKLIIDLYNELKKDLPRFIPVALCVIGDGLRATNAEGMKAQVSCELGGERYEVTAKFKIKKL